MANTADVLRLIEQLSKKTGQVPDHAGFGKMCEMIDEDEISQRYLYDLYTRTIKLHANGVINTQARSFYLDAIAKYLGYSGFIQFSVALENIISEKVRSCIGNWWSYVRANAEDYLYKAPVSIFTDSKMQMRMHLKGNERNFFGEIVEKGQCLFIYLESGTDKQIGLVLRIGSTKRINLLQGTFSGISSVGDPIAGREILIREKDKNFVDMNWEKLQLTDENVDERIRTYFSNYSDNCIRVNNISGFDMENLLTN